MLSACLRVTSQSYSGPFILAFYFCIPTILVGQMPNVGEEQGPSRIQDSPSVVAVSKTPFRGLTEVNPPREAPGGKTTVLYDVTLVDGRGGSPVEDRVVVVEGSRIAQIGKVGELTWPENAEVINAANKTLLPGLIDPHLHVGRDTKTMIRRPGLILQHGVTTARDPGRAIEDYAALRASGKPAPRLFLTGKHLDQEPHAHPYNAVDIQSATQAQDFVDQIVDQGGSAIKVYYRLPLPLIEATCTQADRHGIPVTAHLELIDADKAIAAGIDGIEHVTSCGTSIADPADANLFRQTVDLDNAARRPWRFRLWAQIDLEHPRVKQFIDLLVKRGIFITPTLNVFERRIGDRFDSELVHIDGFQTMLQFVGMCHKAGVPICASSHGNPPVCEEGWAMQHEMRLLHEAGLSPLEVITASTLTPAQFFGCADRLGSIEVGKQADLVLYRGKPHEDLNDLWKVDLVMQAGRWVDGERPFFQLSQRGGKHRLTDPDGKVFIPMGVNHISAVARDPRYFAEHFDRDWDLFRKHLDQQFSRWNMNCVGYGAPGALQQHYPYFATITLAPIEKHRSHPDPSSSNGYHFPDPFDPQWATEVEGRIRSMCEKHRGNPHLIGYLWTDTPTWDLIKTRGLRSTDWVTEIRKRPANAPGRIRYHAFLKARYGDRLDDLTSLYGLSLQSWNELEKADFSNVAIGRQLVQADDSDFLELIAEQFYSAVGAVQRKHDPRHLVFGDRFLLGDHPDNVLRQAVKWIDAVAVQPGDLYAPLYPPSTRFAVDEFRKIYEVTGKPILICDHAISYPTSQHPRTIFEQEPDESAAAIAIDRFLDAAFAEPYMLGYLKCQYIDRPSGFGRGLRQGLLKDDGTPRTAIVAAYSQAFATILDDAKPDSQNPVGVEFRKDSLKRIGGRGDNWCITWAADDTQFTSMDDGDWLRSGTAFHNRIYQLSGPAHDFQRQDVTNYPQLPMSGPGWFGYGIVGVEQNLYATVSLTPSANWDGPFRGMMMLHSPDVGATWQRLNSQGMPVDLPVGNDNDYQVDPEAMFFFEQAGRAHDGEQAYPFSFCSFIQHGRGNAAAADDYIYVYSPEGAQSNELLLARVKATEIPIRSRWEYNAGHNGDVVIWTKDLNERKPVHVFPARSNNGDYFGWYSWLPSVVWNDGLQCYIMVNGGTYGGRGMTNSAQDYYDRWMHTKTGSLGFWYSTSPTGPWHQLFYEEEWTVDDPNNRTYQPKLSAKWIRDDGRTMTLIWSDAMKNDQGRSHTTNYRWNQMDIEIELAE